MTHTVLLALTPEQLEISPGVGAFTVFFVLAIAVALLVMNMSKHLRRVDRHRIEAEVRAEIEAEMQGEDQTPTQNQPTDGQEPDQAG